MTRAVLEGRPGSPGVGIGRLLWLGSVNGHSGPGVAAGSAGPDDEVERLRSALDMAALDLEALGRDLADRAGAEIGAIFEAQALFARDPGIVDPAIALIRSGHSAAVAIERAAAEQADALALSDEPYIRERAADLRDVARRVVDLLTGRARPELHYRDGTPAVIAADDLEPSLFVTLRPELVTGVALAAGAPNGHAAIVARALGIPLALGLGSALDASSDGRACAVDGGEGRLVIDPTSEDLAAVARHAVTPVVLALAVGLPVAVEANVGSVREAELAAQAGADGIGLVRTELLFLGRAAAPGLAEQRSLYRRIAVELDGKPVTFRTLDIGCDKPADFLDRVPEANPALGVRGIRLGLRDPELFETQLRALLEARPSQPLRILLPMVTTVEEVGEARAAIARAAEASRATGVPIASDIRVGVMIEVPAAALLADALAAEVDFLSIGTNDLVQYTLAADRTNPALTELASPLQPAILRLVAEVARAGAATRRPVAVCGEAAADPLAGPLFVGLGVTELSVAPGSVAAVRARIGRLGLAACREAADAALSAHTKAEVIAILERRLGSERPPA